MFLRYREIGAITCKVRSAVDTSIFRIKTVMQAGSCKIVSISNFLWLKMFSLNTVFLGENVIQIAKMQSSVATNLHYFSILFYNKSQKWKILATLGLF